MLTILKNKSLNLKAVIALILLVSTQLTAKESVLVSSSSAQLAGDPIVLNITTDDVLMEAGKDYQVDFYADATIYGFQYTINFDKEAVEFLRLGEGVSLENNFGFTKLDKGAITCSWNEGAPVRLKDKALFSLHFKAKKAVLLSEVLSINSRFTKAEAYSENMELMDVKLGFGGAASSLNILYQNNPNPFKGATVVDFQLVNPGSVSLKIVDVNGKVIRILQKDCEAGLNRFEIKNLDAKGVMYYTLEAGDFSATKKMIVMD